MNAKTTKIIYWTGVILTSLWFGASGFFELEDVIKTQRPQC